MPVVGSPHFVNSKRCGIDVVRPAFVGKLSHDPFMNRSPVSYCRCAVCNWRSSIIPELSDGCWEVTAVVWWPVE